MDEDADEGKNKIAGVSVQLFALWAIQRPYKSSDYTQSERGHL